VKYPWITWIGLLIILWVALSMMWGGWNDIEKVYPHLLSGPELLDMIRGRR
jgi:predicted tellurium resistance membrane protein TerC